MDTQADPETLQALQQLWHWIPGWIDQAQGEAGRMVVFRRQITLPSVPKQTVIRISADTRYKLLVNGQRVCVGPARGSDRLWFYDTVDLGPFLQVGLNTGSESNGLSEEHKSKAEGMKNFFSSMNLHLREVYRGMGVQVSAYSTPDNSLLGIKFGYPGLEHILDSDPNMSVDEGMPTATDGEGGGSEIASRSTDRNTMTGTACGIARDNDHLHALLRDCSLISEEDALELKREGAAFLILKDGPEALDINVEVDNDGLLVRTKAGNLPQHASIASLYSRLSDRADLFLVFASEAEDQQQSKVKGDDTPHVQDKDQDEEWVKI